MLRESSINTRPPVKTSDSPLDSIIRTLRCAAYRAEDEARDLGDNWTERLELAGLIGEAVDALRALPEPAPSREEILAEVCAALEANDGIGSWQEAVGVVNRLRPGAPQPHPLCSCNQLLCEDETFDCGECGRELPVCREVCFDSVRLCDDCDPGRFFAACGLRPAFSVTAEEMQEVAA